MAYYVGMKAGNGKVSTIELDGRHLHQYGKMVTLCTSRQMRDRCYGNP